MPKPFEEIKSKDLSLPRNPIIAKLFRMVRLAENAGYGFDKLEHSWIEYNGTAPEYLIEFDSVMSKFYTDELTAADFMNIATELRDALKEDKLSIQLLQSRLEFYKAFVKEKNPSLFSKLNEKNVKMDWMLFMIIELDSAISLQSIGNILEITRRTVDFHINQYRSDGYIKRIGSRKTGEWIIS